MSGISTISPIGRTSVMRPSNNGGFSDFETRSRYSISLICLVSLSASEEVRSVSEMWRESS